MINLTINELSVMEQAINRLTIHPLPAKIAFQFGKFAKKVVNELDNYEDTRMKTLKNYAMLDPNGGLIIDEHNEAKFETPEKREQFMKEIDELRQTEIEFNFQPIPISAIPSDINIPAGDLMLLDKIIIEK
jgi:hypothetical protein